MNDQNKSGENKALKILANSLARNILIGIAAVIVLIVVALGVRKYLSTESQTTRIGFEDIGELATEVAYCEEVNVTEAPRELWGVTIPFTQSKYIYSYDVEIKAGLDFGEIRWRVDEENAVIQVELPEARVLSRELDTDSFKLYHEEESIFRQITMEENNEALASLLDTAEADAVANGLLDEARSNAETILRGFFANVYDLGTYEIRFANQ